MSYILISHYRSCYETCFHMLLNIRTTTEFKGPLTCKIFIAEKGSVLLEKKLCGTL